MLLTRELAQPLLLVACGASNAIAWHRQCGYCIAYSVDRICARRRKHRCRCITELNVNLNRDKLAEVQSRWKTRFRLHVKNTAFDSQKLFEAGPLPVFKCVLLEL